MKVAILGYGVEGQSAYRYWSKKGAEITLCDAKTDLELPESVVANLGPNYLKELDGFDLIVRSPGIRPDLISSDVAVTSVTREFMAKCPAPIIGVTGTKGKGTTASLIARILEADGKRVWLGGNIGTPPLDFLSKVKSEDYVVLELSSFQLIDVTTSPHIAVGLMIADDHLDYHSHMEEYIQAKGNIFRFQTKADTAVYHGGDVNTKRIAELSKGRHISYATPEGAYVRDGKVWFRDSVVCALSDVRLIGRHNLDNVCAAVATTHDLLKDPKAAIRAVRSFTGLPHRLELVRELDGVRYVNDSIAVNPAAAIASLQAFAEPKVVILGGFDRGVNLQDLADTLAATTVRQAILVGQTAAKLASACDTAGFKHYVHGPRAMAQIVSLAQRSARAGDIVLLAPGSASFDHYNDYADRGEQFRAAVQSLGQTYETFVFEGYQFNPQTKQAQLNYSFDGKVKFTETYQFDFELADYDKAALDRALFGLFMMAGVSYYKAGRPPKIELRQGELTQAQADFFAETYRLGLGEFSYRNQLPLVEVKFPVSSEAKPKSQPIKSLQGNLIAVGGGKDSIVSVELLSQSGADNATWMVNHSDQMEPLLAKIGLPHYPVIRTISPELIRLNQEGAANGHVPISAILGFAGLVTAILAGKQNVVVSNEWSAGEGNVEYQGTQVNHQYSKSFGFEKDFQEYIHDHISPTLNYYSLLRPLSELKIAEVFSDRYLAKYAGTFSSCNRNFHLSDHGKLFWCGECPKCAFVYLVLAPFVPRKRLMELFGGRNLFESDNLTQTYQELLGLSGHKPFECVGEIKECRQAVVMAKATGEYPELDKFVFPEPNFAYQARHADLIPAQYKSLIKQL